MNKLKSNIILLLLGIIILPIFSTNCYSNINKPKIEKDTLINNIDNFKLTSKIRERFNKYDIDNKFEKTAELHIGNITENWKVINIENITVIKIDYLKDKTEYLEYYFIENEKLIYSLKSENMNSKHYRKCEYFYTNKLDVILLSIGLPGCRGIRFNNCQDKVILKLYKKRKKRYKKLFK